MASSYTLGGTPDNIYQPQATDPASGTHGVAETFDATISAVQATQTALNRMVVVSLAHVLVFG